MGANGSCGCGCGSITGMNARRWSCNGSLQLFGSNPHRRSLILSSDTLNSIWLSFDGPMTSFTQGIHIPLNTPALIITKELIGNAVTGPLFLFTTALVVNVAYEFYNIPQKERTVESGNYPVGARNDQHSGRYNPG